MATYEKTSSEVERLSIFIDEYESIHHKYPGSMADLELSMEDVETQGLVFNTAIVLCHEFDFIG